MIEINARIDSTLRKVIRFLAEIPEASRAGFELLIQLKFEEEKNSDVNKGKGKQKMEETETTYPKGPATLTWAAYFPEDEKVLFVATMTHEAFQWCALDSTPLTSTKKDILTTKFNIFDIFLFVGHRRRRVAHSFRILIDLDSVFMDFYDQYGQPILHENFECPLGLVDGSLVESFRYQSLVQEFNNPRPFLTLDLETKLLRDIMDYSEKMMDDHGPEHDLPISFIAFNKILLICAGKRYSLTEQMVQDDSNEGNFRVLRFNFNVAPPIYRALQLAKWVCISNMPPMLTLELSPHINLTVYMPRQSVCNPQSLPAV